MAHESPLLGAILMSTDLFLPERRWEIQTKAKAA